MIPLAFPVKKALRDDTGLLAADVGGTKTDVALFKRRNAIGSKQIQGPFCGGELL